MLSVINGPGLGDGEYIILRPERIAVLTSYFPDFQDWKTLPVKGMVGMEDRYSSQIPAVIKCFLLLSCQP